MTDLPAQQDEAKRESRVGLWLSLVLGTAITVLAGMAVVSTVQLVRGRLAEHQAGIEKAEVLTQQHLAANRNAGQTGLPGFQIRGSSLVGEFTAQDGTLIRLVIDAKTQKVIGAKVIRQGALADRR